MQGAHLLYLERLGAGREGEHEQRTADRSFWGQRKYESLSLELVIFHQDKQKSGQRITALASQPESLLPSLPSCGPFNTAERPC